jgi:hypothetical protein
MKMLCKDCDKIIQLYWNQQLDEKKRKEVEKHLSECKRCKEKLEALKIIEEKAKRIKTPEPGAAYWESFSQRVREKIISKQKQSFGHKIKEFFANIPALSPARLKVAAAIASFILVFIVGKLYIDYRGTIPERIKYAEKEIPEVKEPEIEKEISVPVPEETAPLAEEKKIEKRKAPETKKGAIKEERGKGTPDENAELMEGASGSPVILKRKRQVTKGIGEKAPVPEVMEREVTKPVEKEIAPKAAMRTLADAQDKKAKPRSKVQSMAVAGLEGEEAITAGYFFIPESLLAPDVHYLQKKLSGDSLTIIIDFWKEFIRENPEDPFVEKAYLQIAATDRRISENIKRRRDQEKFETKA